MSPAAEKSATIPSFGLPASVERLRFSLRKLLPAQLAAHTGAGYRVVDGAGELSLSLFNQPIRLTYPGLIAVGEQGQELPLAVQALLLYYFSVSDGGALAGKWVSFGDLPGGRMYERAFQGYSGDKLAGLFGNEIGQFQAACRAAGGQTLSGGDAAFLFFALPRVPVCVTYWQGDDEFPAACKLLFDPSVCNHLPIDVVAILGSMLVSRIIKAAGESIQSVQVKEFNHENSADR